MEGIQKSMQKMAALRGLLTSQENVNRIIETISSASNQVEFKLTDKSCFDSVPPEPGIYFIQIKFPFKEKSALETFGASWGSAKGKNLIHDCPRFYKGRVKANLNKLSENDYVSLYLGKQQDVKARLISHLTDPIESTTYGLKLEARSKAAKGDLFAGCHFRASWVTFGIKRDDSSYFCMELLEDSLRKRLNPILGKQ